MFSTLSEHYPFITLCVYAGVEYVGIIQNQDNTVTTLYDFGSIIDADQKKLFLELAAVWWWESNRMLPINIFLKHEWDPFNVCNHCLFISANPDGAFGGHQRGLF